MNKTNGNKLRRGVSTALGSLLLSTAGILAPTAAHAAFAVPLGTQVGNTTDLLTITGTYSSGTGAPPFASPSFTLSFIIPDQVSIEYPVGSPPDGLFRTSSSGTYNDGGTSTSFSTDYLEFGNFTNDVNGTEIQATDPASQVSDQAINNFLHQGDDFNFYTTTTPGPIYTFSNGGHTATANVGSVLLTSGGANYSLPSDPPFTGTITITPNGGPIAALPELSTWAMLIGGVGAIGVSMRRKRSGAARLAA